MRHAVAVKRVIRLQVSTDLGFRVHSRSHVAVVLVVALGISSDGRGDSGGSHVCIRGGVDVALGGEQSRHKGRLEVGY